MFLLDSAHPTVPRDLVFSATDLVTAATCEYRLLRILDELLKRTPKASFPKDEMLARAAALGDVHEHRVLDQFLAQFGSWDPTTRRGVYDVEPANRMERGVLEAKHAESIDALKSGADVVFQAAFFDGSFHGRSDFLLKQPNGNIAVFDTKLARHAKVTALLQLAAYGDQLFKAGIPPDPTMTLVLGNGVHSDHSLTDVLPVFYERRARLLTITAEHRTEEGPVQWGDERYTACGRCDYCAEQVTLHRDLLLVAGMTLIRRKKLITAGITTIDQLAALPSGGAEEPDGTLAKLREQAGFQAGTALPDGSVNFPDKAGAQRTVSYKVLPGNTLDRLPEPSPGDIFFDFEGDPLWQDPTTGSWGMEYLFGVVENASEPGGKPPFKPLWAHSRAEERQAFVDFLAYVEQRRREYPDLHIYHYAPYEKSALRHLSVTHVVGEAAVDNLLRDGVLVDLYETVRHSLRISESSYSIKKLEPLYMGSHLRSGEVKDAGASVVAYANYCQARDTKSPEEAATILAGISDYNEYDCLSTLELRNWLLTLAAERGISPAERNAIGHDNGGRVGSVGTRGNDDDDGQAGYGALPEETRLLDYVAARQAALPPGEPLTADDQAIAMVGAAVGYHRREDKQFWWGHFDRLSSPTDQWAETRDVFVIYEAQVIQDWAKPTPRSNPVRTVRLLGALADGSGYQPGNKLFRMYQEPLPDGVEVSEDPNISRGGWFGTEVIEVDRSGTSDVLLVKEKLRRGVGEYQQLPFALTPGEPVATKGQKEALSELAIRVGLSLPSLPGHPALDLLRRIEPRLATLPALPEVGAGPDAYIDAITAAVADLDHSYLAVQGPPGTGKTYVGSHVVARLVARGWKIGIVGQSHAVVENMLCAAVLQAGVPADRVAKEPKFRLKDAPWLHQSDEDMTRLLAEEGGCLVGGTAWAMTGSKIPAGALDLLVIDEAGQFSLANTLAVSRATKRLLLLGDPQQLPQVSQGKHPEPVDESALGWLSHGRHTLPPELGYFLATSWRMHPDLCASVSRLSYDGKLESAPAAALRHLDGVPAGVRCVYVDHTGNTTKSPEEAEEVARQVRAHLGLLWADPQDPAPRPLEETDILVVAAYNAQVQQISDVLTRADLRNVRVGTVDKFQGQEAPVVIVSMAASVAAGAPRGPDFLLSRNRINVAVSRGQWRAVVVRSPELTNYLPVHPEGLEQLGAFVGLCNAGSGD
ncbi:TM0106 family RecB-like putative nuclease [Paenarthrobacter sp. Z7-10]|uniref:TM0106 family RecB-like putative nuclease n=1 Tax=Paenarthrobacter sp. Z7-10 TaxID=2787635 RepID=UPI0022A9AF2D|nr:bifunctional RecB family nuclease/DEAD/DEAH box helicase [Paenarthrobacter sp. Z7-10]MCZ2404632.1 TM0106 family RecB-like putative nuclease [Paenarthrobacter sp. Z7-10]